jgi:hypothetical protein
LIVGGACAFVTPVIDLYNAPQYASRSAEAGDLNSEVHALVLSHGGTRRVTGQSWEQPLGPAQERQARLR